MHQAPLNTDCEDDPDPDSTCDFLIVETPADWATTNLVDSTWAIWGTDLEVDNTVLLRTTDRTRRRQ